MKKGTQHGEHTSAAFRHGSVIVADVAYRGEDACNAHTAMKRMLDLPQTQPPSIGCKAAIASMASLNLENTMTSVLDLINASRDVISKADEDYNPVELYRFAMANWPTVNTPSRLLATWRRRGNSMRAALLRYSDQDCDSKLYGWEPGSAWDEIMEDRADEWESYDFTPDNVEAWWDAGCWDPPKAAELRDAGIDPSLLVADGEGRWDGRGQTIGRMYADGCLTLDDVREMVA